jgi:sarcosine oxidase subunit beta
VSQTADVVIVGAGIIGGSVAFHLLERDPGFRVVVLEKEAEPETGATSKATGGVRFQFSTEANVRLLGSPVDFTRHGYLFVTTDPATLEQCRRNVALQRGLGVAREILTPAEMLLDGRASSMDVGALSLERFAAGKLRAEAIMF